MSERGRLLVCATPIGNLKDVTLRVLDALRTADLVAAEDTRVTRKLLAHYSISAPLVSFHARNEKRRTPELLAKLESGATVAVVSDAGTPGISDPGHRLIRASIDAGIPVEVLPGPNAALTALVASGLPADVFTFAGFAPRRPGPRRRFFEDLVAAGHTFVLYESPHRIVGTLADLAEVCPTCGVAVARELTKVYEEIVRGDAAAVAGEVAGKQPRGEYVVVASPPAPSPAKVPPDPESTVEQVANLERDGVDRKEAMRQVARRLGLSRRDVYDALTGKRARKGDG